MTPGQEWLDVVWCVLKEQEPREWLSGGEDFSMQTMRERGSFYWELHYLTDTGWLLVATDRAFYEIHDMALVAYQRFCAIETEPGRWRLRTDREARKRHREAVVNG